jgi:putative ABC transport system substrate-binding protein
MMLTRRLLTLALALAPLVSLAQQPAKTARIGVLGLANPTAYAAQLEAFRGGLKDLGYVEGKNILIDYRWADGHYERLRDLTAELVKLKVEVLVTHGAGGVAAKSVTSTIPIVTYMGDMVASGLAASLARPGGNVTGSSFLGAELTAKRLELLKEATPRVIKIAVISNAASPGAKPTFNAMQATAKQLKLDLRIYSVNGPADIEGAFTAISKDRADALTVLDDPMLIANFKAIAASALKHRLPAIGFTGFADAGGLMTSGVSLIDLWRRDAYFVDKLLKGTNAENLPIEQPTKFELIVNLKTARAIGVRIPQTLIQRADKVIE